MSLGLSYLPDCIGDPADGQYLTHRLGRVTLGVLNEHVPRPRQAGRQHPTGQRHRGLQPESLSVAGDGLQNRVKGLIWEFLGR